MQTNISWRWILTEAAVIAFSVLLAFWVDAWWSERVDDERVESLLQSLEREWVSNLEELDVTTSLTEQYMAFTARRINANLQVKSSPDKELPENPFNDSYYFDYYVPSMGAWNAVVLAALSDLDDAELASAIASWRSVLEHLEDEQELIQTITFHESLRKYAHIRQSMQIGVDPNTGSLRFDTNEQEKLYHRTVMQNDERAELWRWNLEALHYYHVELKKVRGELEKNLKLLQSRHDN